MCVSIRSNLNLEIEGVSGEPQDKSGKKISFKLCIVTGLRFYITYANYSVGCSTLTHGTISAQTVICKLSTVRSLGGV